MALINIKIEGVPYQVEDGITILDSIASNACAHHFMNMLFLLGDTMESTAKFASAKGKR